MATRAAERPAYREGDWRCDGRGAKHYDPTRGCSLSPSRFVLAGICVALTVSCQPQGASDRDYVYEPLFLEVVEGRRLSGEEVAARERQLREDPADVVLRAGLLGYYWPRPGREAHAGHVLWFVENAPESPALQPPWGDLGAGHDPEGYERIKRAWLRHIEREPTNTTFLERASSFVDGSDTPLARELLERGEELDPRNPHWAQRLGTLRWREAGRSGDGWDPGEAARALADFERAYQLTRFGARYSLLTGLGKAALAAGDLAKARHYAERMLENRLGAWFSEWDEGNRVHYGNVILGRIALADGDVEGAEQHLLAAGRMPGSDSLKWGGPDMALAKDLLEHGRRESVLRYLELCLDMDLWETHQERLRNWIALVEAGRTPDFGSNLSF